MNLYFSSWTYTISPEAASDGEEASDIVVCGEGHSFTLPEEGPLASMISSWLSSVRRILRLFKKLLCMDPVYDEILASVRGRILKQHIRFRKPQDEGLNLAVTLRHLVSIWHHVLWHAVWVEGAWQHSVYRVREVCQTICDEYADEVMTKMDVDNLLMDSTGVEISPLCCCYWWQACGNHIASSVWLIML